MSTSPHSVTWVRELARPYLRGYRPRAAAPADGLRGWRFVAPTRSARTRHAAEIGFFVGYITDSAPFSYLPCDAPACAVFAFVEPRSSAMHRRLVVAEDALVRRTFTYIRWLTHRPPRFQFFERELAALIRHRSLAESPREKHDHFSRNFFIETLAWLVRSGLVRKLAEEAAARGVSKLPTRKKPAKGKKKSRGTR